MKKRKDNRKLSTTPTPSDPVREPEGEGEGDRFEAYASRGRRLIASGPVAIVALVVIAIALLYR